MTAAINAMGHPASPRSRTLHRSRPPGVSVVRCGLVTGRMHQIRVHFAARGWPLVGDTIYGGARPPRIADPMLAERLRRFPRQALHAWHVAFDHPVTGARLQIEAPVPEDLRGLLDELGQGVLEVLEVQGVQVGFKGSLAIVGYFEVLMKGSRVVGSAGCLDGLLGGSSSGSAGAIDRRVEDRRRARAVSGDRSGSRGPCFD